MCPHNQPEGIGLDILKQFTVTIVFPVSCSSYYITPWHGTASTPFRLPTRLDRLDQTDQFGLNEACYRVHIAFLSLSTYDPSFLEARKSSLVLATLSPDRLPKAVSGPAFVGAVPPAGLSSGCLQCFSALRIWNITAPLSSI